MPYIETDKQNFADGAMGVCLALSLDALNRAVEIGDGCTKAGLKPLVTQQKINGIRDQLKRLTESFER